MPLRHRCGLKLSPEAPKLRFGSYFKSAIIPQIPATFGHYDLIPAKGWGMLGNDTIGDCTIAEPMHVSMLWNKMAGRSVKFTTLDAYDDYRDCCGWKGDAATDQGGDMVSVAQYWRNTGMRDCADRRHTIIAYLQVDATNLDHVDAACYLFGAVGLGVQLPATAEDQFENDVPWEVVPNDPAEDFHCVPMVGKAQYRKVVTWGALQDVQDEWLRQNLKEVVAVISAESLVNGKTLEGFDVAALQSDLEAIGQG